MKRIITTLMFLSIVISAVAQQGQGRGNHGNHGNHGNGNGWGNSNNNNSGNNWGQNGNGNAFGQGNGNNGGGSSSAGAGESTAANQTANIALSNAIEITFTGNMSTVGADVTIPFTTVNDYANGVESSDQELKVRSNKDFSVAVKASSTNFSYSGNTNPAPTMPVSGVLAVKVTANGTGGAIASPFSSTAYATLTNTNQGLISSADRGGNQTFSVKYKATPGFAYPAGTYTVDVVYTATQE